MLLIQIIIFLLEMMLPPFERYSSYYRKRKLACHLERIKYFAYTVSSLMKKETDKERAKREKKGDSHCKKANFSVFSGVFGLPEK